MGVTEEGFVVVGAAVVGAAVVVSICSIVGATGLEAAIATEAVAQTKTRAKIIA